VAPAMTFCRRVLPNPRQRLAVVARTELPLVPMQAPVEIVTSTRRGTVAVPIAERLAQERRAAPPAAPCAHEVARNNPIGAVMRVSSAPVSIVAPDDGRAERDVHAASRRTCGPAQPAAGR